VFPAPKALGGRGFAPDSTGGAAFSMQTDPLADGQGAHCSLPQEPHCPLSALQSGGLG